MRIRRHPEFRVRVRWRETGNVYFPWASKVDGVWWVLRLNSWPDHPMHTFFADGVRKFDLDSEPLRWDLGGGKSPQNVLSESDVQEALAPIEPFLAYGSEVGQPCDNPFCCG